MNRRQTLQVMAGIAVATAVSGVTWNDKEESTSSTRGDAYEPWRTWPHGSGLMLAASAAVLAASPHNTQPWQFHIAANRMELFADPKRRLGTIDPLLREQQIGTGCALENLLVAAEATGLGVQEIALDPDPVSNRIASVRFGVRAPRESALYRAISHRHTNRGPYLADRAISGALLNEMDSLNTDRDSVQLILWTGRNRHEAMRELIIAATEAIAADRQQSHDSSQWYRGTPGAIQRYRDGVTLEAQGLSPVMVAISKLLPAPSQQVTDKIFVERTKNIHCGRGATFGTILARPSGGKLARVQIGRLWQRIHLWGTVHGLAMQPLNQIHERMDREATTPIEPTFTRGLGGLTNDPNWSGLFSFRMGFAERSAKPSPRRDLTQFLI